MESVPNGNPKFREEELPGLELFFSSIADTLNEFAAKHNLRIDRYYHQSPSWAFRFRHPKGGAASVEVMREADDSIMVYSSWWLDDYKAFTRFARGDEGVQSRMGDENLEQILEEQFRRILSWELGEWTEVVTGFEAAWESAGKEYVEGDVERYPMPRV